MSKNNNSNEEKKREESVLGVIRAARPNLRNSHDKIAFAVHSSFISSGYSLHATGPSAVSHHALASTSTSDEVGIDEWNLCNDEYAFIYSHPDKASKKFLVKCLIMNDKLLVDALSDDGSEPIHLEINVGDYDGENSDSNYRSRYKDLQKLVTIVDKEILAKLDCASTEQSSSAQSSSSRTRSMEVIEPPTAEPYPSRIVEPPIPTNPFGFSDLYPGPGAGMFPTRGDIGSGGMLVGPDNPMFFGGGLGSRPAFPGGVPGVPPGARFDPYGPPGVPGFEPSRFVRDPRRPGGGTHPDLEHFRDDSDFI